MGFVGESHLDLQEASPVIMEMGLELITLPGSLSLLSLCSKYMQEEEEEIYIEMAVISSILQFIQVKVAVQLGKWRISKQISAV